MGIGAIELEFLLNEHRHRPITGKVLTLGRQSVNIPSDELTDLLRTYAIPMRTSGFEIDHLNHHLFGGIEAITDQSLFSAMTDCDLHVLDISDYEGADIVCDICSETPSHLFGSFDFIIEGGSLDNMFDPVRALRNMCDMLRPGGRILIFAWANSFPTSYLKFSPDWVMDYFAVNEWADCKTYVTQYARVGSDCQISAWQYDPYEMHGGQVGYECSNIVTECPRQTICIAERGNNSSTHRIAVQKHYRGPQQQPYLTSIERFRASARPPFRSPLSVEMPLDPISPFSTMQLRSVWSLRPWS